MNKGDTIKCHDADEMIEVMTALAEEGIESDFLYEKDGKKGYWLIITKIRRHMNGADDHI